MPIYLRAEGYLAVTSNTLQFGGLLEAGFDGGFFSADGHLALDAIFQFDPFEFDVRFSAGFHVNVLGKEFYGVECSGRITGPSPVVIRARISYKTPFFLPDINWSDTFTIGSGAPRLASTADLFEAMKKELVPANLRAEGGEDPHVTLKVKSALVGDKALVSPLGRLVWAQRLAPLDLSLERLQNVPLASPNGVTVSATGQLPDGPRERFNLGMYRNLSDAERLNLNVRVEDHLAGVRLGFAVQKGASATRVYEFEEHYRPPRPEVPVSGSWFTFSRTLLEMVSARSAPAQVANLEPRVTTPRESWRAAGQTFDTQAAAHITARATGTVAHLSHGCRGRRRHLMANIEFVSYERSSAAGGATPEGNRLKGRVPFKLDELHGGQHADIDVEFLLMGPEDVGGLKPGAVRRTYPAHGAFGVETNKCVYVEFAATDLPWRYTSATADGNSLTPWLALVVGTPAEVVLLPGGSVVLAPGAVITEHPLAQLSRWAHVQDYGGVRVSRLVSPRVLKTMTSYVAVLVPAGGNALPAGTRIPAYYAWQFTTSDFPGSFRELAQRLYALKPQPAKIGFAALAYQTATGQTTLGAGALGWRRPDRPDCPAAGSVVGAREGALQAPSSPGGSHVSARPGWPPGRSHARVR